MAILAIDFAIIDSAFGLKFRNYKKKITSLSKFSFNRLNNSAQTDSFERRDFFELFRIKMGFGGIRSKFSQNEHD